MCEDPDCNSDLVNDEVGKPMPNSFHEAFEMDFMRDQRLEGDPHSRCCACAQRGVGWRHDAPGICHAAQRLEDDWDFSQVGKLRQITWVLRKTASTADGVEPQLKCNVRQAMEWFMHSLREVPTDTI